MVGNLKKKVKRRDLKTEKKGKERLTVERRRRRRREEEGGEIREVCDWPCVSLLGIKSTIDDAFNAEKRKIYNGILPKIHKYR